MSRLGVGATLGPVFRTMNLARRPAEIWMASYMFSRISREMYAWLQKNAGHGVEFYSPYDRDDSGNVIPISPAAGAYSDHLFFELKDADENTARSLLVQAKNHALRCLMEDMKAAGALMDEEEKDCLAFLDRYIYVLPVFQRIGDEEKIKTHELTDALDRQELYPPFHPEEEMNRAAAGRSDYMLRYLNADALRNSGWMREAAARISLDFSRMQNTASQDLMQHEYVAMVQADGDGMGKLLKALSVCGDLDGLRKVSSFLFGQTNQNILSVQAFGGIPVYFGGDDMLFFAPLQGQGSETVFELVSRLSRNFDDAWKKIAPCLNGGKEQKLAAPSLSFGIALYYRKHPLRFIREAAAGALFDQAKNALWADGKKKKAIQIELRKHSGQTGRLLLSNHEMPDGQTPYSLFIQTIKDQPNEQTLHALHWKLIEQWNVIYYLLRNEDSNERKIRLTNWFENNFNEWLAENDGNAEDTKAEQDFREQFKNDTVSFLCTLADQTKAKKQKELQIADMLKEHCEKLKNGLAPVLQKISDGPAASYAAQIADAVKMYGDENFRYGREMFAASAARLLVMADGQTANEKLNLMRQVDNAFRIDEFLHAKRKTASTGGKGGKPHA